MSLAIDSGNRVWQSNRRPANSREGTLQPVYTSSEADRFSGPDLVRLLKKSRQNDEALEVTGRLLYHNGVFSRHWKAVSQASGKWQTALQLIQGTTA